MTKVHNTFTPSKLLELTNAKVELKDANGMNKKEAFLLPLFFILKRRLNGV
jgi:hypothetical protein